MQDKPNILFAVSFGLGLLSLVIYRAIFTMPEHIHFHANYGVFINEKQELFDGFGYYEEVSACNEDSINNPRIRAHMHKPDNDVIHIHDYAVTWGNYFENIGWSVSDQALTTPTSIYVSDQDSKLTYYLNGSVITNIAERLIESEDKLLISYGQDVELNSQFDLISETASEHNESDDPAGCGGSEHPTLLQRIKHAILG